MLQRVARNTPIEMAAAQLIASRRTENTRAAYTTDFARWLAFCRARGFDPGDPTLPAAVLFRDELKNGGYSAASIQRFLSTLCFVYRGLTDGGIAPRNPFAKTILPRPIIASDGRTKILSNEECQLILDLAERDTSEGGRRDYAVLRLLHDTGLRRASVASLQRDALFTEKDKHFAWVTVKGERQVRTAIPREAMKAIERWLEVAPESPYLFHSSDDPQKHVHLTVVNRIVKRRGLLAGIKKVHPHRFRATFITAAYDARLYERDIQAAVHHALAETTRRYDRHSRGDDVAEQVQKHRKKTPDGK